MTKEEVLSLLLTAGEPVSGEHICRQLGVTRAAVWKAIDQLRQEGYTIEAAQIKEAFASAYRTGSIRRRCAGIWPGIRGSRS